MLNLKATFLVTGIWLSAVLLSAECFAQNEEDQFDGDRPLYEIGVGAAVFELPDYPGSDQSRVRVLGLPYGIYRGKYFRSDQGGGLRGRFFNLERWDLDLSFGAAFPANSEENRAREGMPDLDWIGRIGPRVIYRIIPQESRDRFVLRMPVQTVFSTDFGRLDGRGFVFQPNLVYDYNALFSGRMTISALVGISFASRALMDYFYQVPAKFQTADRPAFSAKPGFLETRYRLGAFWRLTPDYLIAASFGLNSFEGVTNESSPLLKKTWTYTAVFGFIWRIHSSKKRAYR